MAAVHRKHCQDYMLKTYPKKKRSPFICKDNVRHARIIVCKCLRVVSKSYTVIKCNRAECACFCNQLCFTLLPSGTIASRQKCLYKYHA